MSTRYERKNATVTTITDDKRESKTFMCADNHEVPSINMAKRFMREQVAGGDTRHLSVVR